MAFIDALKKGAADAKLPDLIPFFNPPAGKEQNGQHDQDAASKEICGEMRGHLGRRQRLFDKAQRLPCNDESNPPHDEQIKNRKLLVIEEAVVGLVEPARGG